MAGRRPCEGLDHNWRRRPHGAVWALCLFGHHDVVLVDALNLFKLGTHVLADALEINGLVELFADVGVVDESGLDQRVAGL